MIKNRPNNPELKGLLSTLKPHLSGVRKRRSFIRKYGVAELGLDYEMHLCEMAIVIQEDYGKFVSYIETKKKEKIIFKHKISTNGN